MKLFIMFVVVAFLGGLLSAQPVDSSAPYQLQTSGVQRFKRMATLLKCPKNYTKFNRKCIHCDLLITFGLAFILCCSVCFVLILAIITGIAYGYNYAMSEYISFTRSDVTVFMRRGQYQDNPDIGANMRRSGGGDDMFPANITTDYEDQNPVVDGKPLSDAWSKTHDTRKYASSLTKFNTGRKMNVQESEEKEPKQDRGPLSLVRRLPVPVEMPAPVELPTQAPPKEFHLKPAAVSPIISIVPKPTPTVPWPTGSSNIMMRTFKPLYDMTTIKHPYRPETMFPTRSTTPQSIPLFITKERSKSYEDGMIKDYEENIVPMRVWGTTLRTVTTDEPEDIDEENIVYKPV